MGAIFIFILFSFIIFLLGRFCMLFCIHFFEFLVSKNKTWTRFKNMVFCTFWQTLCIFRKADQFPWKENQ